MHSSPFSPVALLAVMTLTSLYASCGAQATRERTRDAPLGSAAHAQATQPEVRGQVAPASVPPGQFATLVERARSASREPHVAQPAVELPPSLRDIDWPTYRTIRYRPERALWRSEPGHFEAQFFHLGFIYREPVAMFVVNGERSELLPFSSEAFAYDGVAEPAPGLQLGYAGLRVHTNLNSDVYRDETIVFQGASYFRSLGRGNALGLSARALAVDTGESTPEEFPRFTEMYLVKPAPGDRSIWLLALLESKRVTGACAFRVTPGESTVVEVRQQLFFREPVAVLGLAPFSSMHLFGESDPHRFDALRPEVHDSDGVAIWSQTGERMFRPLENPARTRVTSYRLDSPKGFGLLQRDRHFVSYQDLEQRYELRPSAWVEPIGDWGAGQLRLLEFATQLESDDNVATLWVPDHVPTEGLSLTYRIYFGSAVEGALFGHAVDTRLAGQGAERARFAIDFHVPDAQALAGPVELEVSAPGAQLVFSEVVRNPSVGGFRARFELLRQDTSRQAELRAFLRSGTDVLTETWSFPWQPKR